LFGLLLNVVAQVIKIPLMLIVLVCTLILVTVMLQGSKVSVS
jgi:hypothetical protein